MGFAKIVEWIAKAVRKALVIAPVKDSRLTPAEDRTF
jgi:hypothetical protein